MNLKLLSEKRVVIINVGMSTADGIPGPLLRNNRFRFIPIPDDDSEIRLPTYDELGLAKYAPHPHWRVHNDPEFETLTYGDKRFTKNGKLNIRVANALKLRQEDFLFFFASLSTEEHRERGKTTGMFLIGYFEIEEILPYNKAKSSPLVRNNAHRLRRNDTGYWIWKGTPLSVLLKHAVPMNRKNLDTYLRTGAGDKLPWNSTDKNGRKRTPLEVINSATRASRRIEKRFRINFWRIVLAQNPKLPIIEKYS
ncbi:MAG: Nmad3 family putative nucleotide modification protein [Candidatus Thorarchaeota archaeon]|jgi:hypothetical protein